MALRLSLLTASTGSSRRRPKEKSSDLNDVTIIFDKSWILFLYIQPMNIVRAVARPMVLRTLSRGTPLYMSSDSWKDRDEAAEKVYITRKESISVLS